MHNRTEDVTTFRRRWYTPEIPPPACSLLWATPAGVLAPPGGTLPPDQGRSDTEDHRNTTRPLILFAAQWLVRPIAPACHQTFCAQCSTKNAPTPWTRYPWGRFSPGCPPPYDHLNSRSPEHAGVCEQIPLRLRITVEALYSQPPVFSNLPGAVSTLVLIDRPTHFEPGQGQNSCRGPATVNVLTPTLNQVRRYRHLHIRCLRSTAPAMAVPCSPMPMVTSVNYMAAYQVCSHPASVCLVHHLVHRICPNAMTLKWKQRAGRTVALMVWRFCLLGLACGLLRVGLEGLKGSLCYRKDILDLCRNSFDEILQVLMLENRTEAASRARAGCGWNQ